MNITMNVIRNCWLSTYVLKKYYNAGGAAPFIGSITIIKLWAFAAVHHNDPYISPPPSCWRAAVVANGRPESKMK